MDTLPCGAWISGDYITQKALRRDPSDEPMEDQNEAFLCVRIPPRRDFRPLLGGGHFGSARVFSFRQRLECGGSRTTCWNLEGVRVVIPGRIDVGVRLSKSARVTPARAGRRTAVSGARSSCRSRLAHRVMAAAELRRQAEVSARVPGPPPQPIYPSSPGAGRPSRPAA